MSLMNRLLDELSGDNGYGVLLLAQMDGVPDTIQLMIATTELDEAAGGLRDKARYLVRAIGVQEHNLSVGIFKSAGLFENEDHPLLYEFNSPPVGLFFRGKIEQPETAILSVFQAHAAIFGNWRHVPAYLNTSKPLLDVFSGEGDLVGEMPRPLADALAPTLEGLSLETKIIEGERPAGMPVQKVLVLDNSYIIAMNFSVEEMGISQ